MTAIRDMKKYRIPENFIDESRIFKGTVRTRFFIEGCIMALIAAIPAFLIPVSTSNARISLVVFLCGFPLVLGIRGINGDPISVTLKSAKSWYTTRGIMLYNNETVALRTTPLAEMETEKRMSDSIIDAIDSIKEARKAKRESEEYIEGVTFEFAEDPTLKRLYADQRDEDEWEDNENKEEKEKFFETEFPENESQDDDGHQKKNDAEREYIELHMTEDDEEFF